MEISDIMITNDITKSMVAALLTGAAHRGFIDIADLAGFPADAIRNYGRDAFVLAIHGRPGNPNDPSIAAIQSRAAQAVTGLVAIGMSA